MSVQEVFSRALPEYLAIGMPYEAFWEGDVWLAVAYRKAHRIRREQANFDAYLQGAYVYDAIMRVAPVLNAFSKNPKPVDWLDKPYDLYPRDQEESIDEKPEPSRGEQKGIAFMLTYMSSHNSVRAKKTDGDGDTEQ